MQFGHLDNRENEISVWFQSGIPQNWEGSEKRIFRVNKHISWKKLVELYNLRGGQRPYHWPHWEVANPGASQAVKLDDF